MTFQRAITRFNILPTSELPINRFITRTLSTSPGISLLASPVRAADSQRILRNNFGVTNLIAPSIQRRDYAKEIAVEGNIDTVRREMINLINKEILDISVPDETKESFLSDKKFQVEEQDQEVTLTKTSDSYRVHVKFPLPVDDYNDDDDNSPYNPEEEAPEEAPEEEEEESEEQDQLQNNAILAFVVEIEHAKPPMEKVIAECAIGRDRRVYIEGLRFGANERRIWLGDLNEDLQSQFYDYFKFLDIDDQMGAFILGYRREFRARTVVEGLKKMKGFLEKRVK